MTVNLESVQRDARPVVDAVRQHHVDVLVLEDATPEALAAMDQAGLSDVLPHHVSAPGADDHGIVVPSRQGVESPATADSSGSWLMTTVATPGGPRRLLAVHLEQPTHAATWGAGQDPTAGPE